MSLELRADRRKGASSPIEFPIPAAFPAVPPRQRRALPNDFGVTGFPASEGYRYILTAAPETAVLPRVLELFAKRALLPTRVLAETGQDAAGDAVLTIEVEITALPGQTAAHVGRCLAGIVGVITVDSAMAA